MLGFKPQLHHSPAGWLKDLSCVIPSVSSFVTDGDDRTYTICILWGLNKYIKALRNVPGMMYASESAAAAAIIAINTIIITLTIIADPWTAQVWTVWVHLHSISFRSIYCSPMWSEQLNPRMRNHRGLTINYTWTFDHQEGQCPNPCTVQGSTVFAVRACFQSTSFPVPLPHSSSATVSPCLGRILSPKTNSCQTPLSHPRLNAISFLLISLQPFSLTWYQEMAQGLIK